MKETLLRHLLSLVFVAGILLAVAGCGSTTTGPITNNPDTASVMVSFKLSPVSDVSPLLVDSAYTLENGAEFKVSMLRFYISRLSLLDSAGNPVAATLVDSTGTPLKYNLTFYDIAAPATQTIRLMARKGSYRGMTFSVGVPDSAPGIRLNHANAAQLSYPLDVDNDMYWGWNPGYVFFKVEGQSRGSGEWQPFVYHIGESKRLLTTDLNGPFTIAAAGEERTLVLNANRLFITPTGGRVPNITGGQDDRIVHGEAMADSMAVNIAMSGFITLKP